VNLNDLAEQLFLHYKKQIPLEDLQLSCQVIHDYLFDRLSSGQAVSVGHFGTWNPVLQKPSLVAGGRYMSRFQVVFTYSKSLSGMSKRKRVELAEKSG
jgi:hypothetical protein